MSLAAVIVETRPLENLKQIIEGHLKFLPEDTKLYVFGSDYVNLLLSQVNFKMKFIYVTDRMSTEDYNRLLTSVDFWNKIEEENILIFQHDSEILRSWDSSFEEFEYLGAPWKFQEHGGNGGLSFRKKSAMLKVLYNKKWLPLFSGNEDVFFSNNLYLTKSIYNKRACESFSCETIFKLGTFGAHAIDKYLSPEQCKQIREQYEQ
jgi:hypothetical protein